ncbi:MAG: hypothetical protein KC729_15650, partial [Candidatus Eisenbacteria bacterium]|nr:hypothetical protein [Candidatus Eisenbacteria bacterium]
MGAIVHRSAGRARWRRRWTRGCSFFLSSSWLLAGIAFGARAASPDPPEVAPAGAMVEAVEAVEASSAGTTVDAAEPGAVGLPIDLADAGALPDTVPSPPLAQEARSTSKKKQKKTPKQTPVVSLSGSFAMRVYYDDNIIHYSDVDLVELSSVPNLGKFRVESADDVIVQPRLELTFVSDRLTGEKAQATLSVSSWKYLENGIKDNESYSLLLKHPGVWRDNFQLTLYHAPMSYLRTFLDRPPYTPRSTPSQYTAFSFASNTGSLAWWKRWSKPVSSKLTLARSARYYNRPFLE